MDPQETERLTTIIRDKLTAGKLPLSSIPRVWGGLGKGEPCDACEEAVEGPAFVLEGIAEGGGTIRFHVRCFQIWDSLRRDAAQ